MYHFRILIKKIFSYSYIKEKKLKRRKKKESVTHINLQKNGLNLIFEKFDMYCIVVLEI